MIVELFGPPGAGKTTLAHAIAAQLRSDGCKVNLRLSNRPGEQMPAVVRQAGLREGRQFSHTLYRLARPATELLSAVGISEGTRYGTAALVSMLPRAGVFQSLRLRQYLTRLSSAWIRASRSCDIAIFDQAFVQAIASVLILRPEISDKQVLAVIEAIPRSDLIILVRAPIPQIERRLARRRRSLGKVGCLFEESRGTVQDHILVADRLNDLLAQRGRMLLGVRSADDCLLDKAAQDVEVEILRMLQMSSHSSTESVAPYGDFQWPVEN